MEARQEFVLFLFSYVILVVWIFFQVSVAVLLENYLAARCPCPVSRQTPE